MLWTPTPTPRGGRRYPDGFIKPCQAVLSHAVPTSDLWQHEIKFDGYRLIARRDGNTTSLWTLPGRDWTAKFTGIMEAVRTLPHNIVIDGEAVCDHYGGGSDFHALRTAAGCVTAKLYAFDLLMLDGEDLRSLPLEERRRQLKEIVGRHDDPHLIYSQEFEGEAGQELFINVCERGLEGVVSKRRNSRYRSGPSPHWRKIKCRDYDRYAP